MYCYCAVSQDKTVQPNWKLRCLYFFTQNICGLLTRSCIRVCSHSYRASQWQLVYLLVELGKTLATADRKTAPCWEATVDAVVRNMVLMLLFWDKWVCWVPHMTSYHSGNALYDFLLPSIHCVGSELQVFFTNETPELLRAGKKCNILGGLSL